MLPLNDRSSLPKVDERRNGKEMHIQQIEMYSFISSCVNLVICSVLFARQVDCLTCIIGNYGQTKDEADEIIMVWWFLVFKVLITKIKAARNVYYFQSIFFCVKNKLILVLTHMYGRKMLPRYYKMNDFFIISV